MIPEGNPCHCGPAQYDWLEVSWGGSRAARSEKGAPLHTACPGPETSRAAWLGARKKMFTLLDLCVSSLRRGHANLLCIVPILTDDPRRESEVSTT